MKVLFENITEYNNNEINKYNKFNMIKSRPFAIYIFILSILFVCFVVINIINGNWKWLLNVLLLTGLLIYYFKFYKEKNDKSHNAKIIDKKYKFVFYNKYMKASAINLRNAKESTINYFEIKKVYETEENFYLYLGENNAMIINKTNFTIGKLYEFRKFIKGKCLLKYRRRYILKRNKKKTLEKKRKLQINRDNQQ